MPKPCHQNWDGMKRNTDGRYCDHCQKTVLDFSAMTDSQVYHFFSQNKDTYCGKFLNTQLQRDIVPVQTQSASVSRGNAFAAVITLVALNTVQVFGQKNHPQKQLITQVENNKEKLLKPKVIITGTITNENGGLLENAKVVFDSIATTTDKDGKFSFEINNDNTDFHYLYFSYEGMSSEVRSYHPAMGATAYDIKLEKPNPQSYYGHTMGAPMISTVKFPSFRLVTAHIAPKSNEEKILEQIAQIIKENPFLKIQIIS